MTPPEASRAAEEIKEQLEERDKDAISLYEGIFFSSREDDEEFELGSFIDKNSQLFTVMGVFGAISIYLTTISTSLTGVNPNLINVGIVASLLIFILSAVQILKEAKGQTGFAEFFLVGVPDLRHLELMLFLTSFILLTGIVVYIALSLPKALTMLGTFLAVVAGWFFYGMILEHVPPPKHDGSLSGYFSSLLSLFFRIFFISIFISLLPILVFAYIIVDYGSLNILAFLYEYIFVESELILTLVLSFFIGIGIASIHFLYSMYSAFRNIHRLLSGTNECSSE